MTDLYLPPPDEGSGPSPFKDRVRAQFRDRNTRFLLIVGGIVIITALVVATVGMSHFKTVQADGGVSSLGKVQAGQTDTLRGGNLTPNVVGAINEQNRRDSEQALQRGETRLPIPVGTPTPTPTASGTVAPTGRPLENPTGFVLPSPPLPPPPTPAASTANRTPAPAELPVAATPASQRNAQTQAAPRQEKPNTSYMSQAGGLMDSWRLTTHQVKADLTKPASAAAVPGTQTASVSGVSQFSTPMVAAGDILYARLVTRAISTAQGPVLAQMVGGPLNGARLLGTFGNSYDRMTMQFVGMTMPDGRSIGINAVAVDPATATTALATDVDYHYFERYGLTLAAAFMTGFGSVLSDAKSTSTTSAFGSTTTESDESTYEDAAYAGVAQVGQAISNDINRNSAFYSKPTVMVESGTLVGILFMQPVEAK